MGFLKPLWRFSVPLRRTGREQEPLVAKEADALLLDAWIKVLEALPQHSRDLESLYEANPVQFNIRALDKLLGVSEKGRLATALRCAGLRTVALGPLVGLGELRRGRMDCTPYEVWTIRGAVAAWSVASRLGYSRLSARELGETLLTAVEQTTWAYQD